jgi:hypothetical protein
LRNKLLEAYRLAAKQNSQSQEKQKDRYDLRTRGSVLEIGDSVLVKKVAFNGKHKLANQWEDDTYVAIEQPNPDIPVYVVRKQTGEGKKRTLHRNLLSYISLLS